MEGYGGAKVHCVQSARMSPLSIPLQLTWNKKKKIKLLLILSSMKHSIFLGCCFYLYYIFKFILYVCMYLCYPLGQYPVCYHSQNNVNTLARCPPQPASFAIGEEEMILPCTEFLQSFIFLFEHCVFPDSSGHTCHHLYVCPCINILARKGGKKHTQTLWFLPRLIISGIQISSVAEESLHFAKHTDLLQKGREGCYMFLS